MGAGLGPAAEVRASAGGDLVRTAGASVAGEDAGHAGDNRTWCNCRGPSGNAVHCRYPKRVLFQATKTSAHPVLLSKTPKQKVGSMAEPPGFREFVIARSPALLRTAWMLTGDAATAEDLLQTALARTWPHWTRINDGHPEAYVRRVMVRAHASWRSRFWTGEVPTEQLPDRAGRAAADAFTAVDDRHSLTGALRGLPVRQRQAVVLRYFDDLSVEDVAEAMNCSPGTVKSQSAKGLAKLRKALAGHPANVGERAIYVGEVER